MLTKIKFAPGIDKQDTAVGAEGRWVDSDNVRFRYGLPEKVGGWQSLLTDSIVGVARKQHAFVDTAGNRYIAIGTDKFLLVYFEGQLFDITPFRCNNAGVVDSLTSSTLATNSTTAKTCTITTTTDHDLSVGDIVELSSVTLPSGTGLNGTDFELKLFQVLSVPTPTTFTIDSLNQATAVISTGGTMTVKVYETVGPAAQTYGYGYGVGNYGGNITGALQNDLDGALAADTAGNNGSGTQIRLTSTTGFPTTGTIAVGNELITYTNIAGNELTGISRGALGTATFGTINGQAHSDGAVVTNATDFTGWGNAVEASTVTLEPGLWSLSNFGEVLVSTIANGKTFTWNSGITARLTTHASMLTSGFETRIDAATDSGNPTATRTTLISPTTRHLIHLGTETTIGTPTSQDDMFIRFSEDESINKYTPQATNTAGTQRLQDGTKIMGGLVAKENILIWTDNALYTMKFVGAPFTFGFEQVGTNCGLIGKNAAIEIDGVAYWMGNNGFFSFDGTVNTLPCSVEDFVYDNADTTKGQQINAGINNLFTEVVWWYPTAGSDFNNRYVVYNYGQNNAQLPMGNWYTGTNTNSIRTTWIDSLVYPKPYATAFNSSNTGTFPQVIGETGLGQSVLFEHETGNDQVNPDGSTTILTSFIQSFSFSLQPDQAEVFLAMRRFLPNFKVLVGNNQVTLSIKDFPSEDDIQTALSPFTINSNTLKVDTRARGRYANIKIENIGVNESWRFGTFQVDIQPDGRRG
jgi:hypothetical protein